MALITKDSITVNAIRFPSMSKYSEQISQETRKRNMNSKSPYLDAIQGIPGKTAKEKYKSLNKIIDQTIANKKVPGDLKSQTIYGSQIPQVLQPIIDTEIAKIQKTPEAVIAALKSDDVVIINRALQADWIFDGSIKSVTNFNYFSKNIFPEVSLNTRASIIKRLSQQLGHKNEYLIAQEFFEGLKNLYNLKQAKPLLSACNEAYLAEIVKNKNIILPKKLLIRLFPKYPELVIHYLKFGSPAPSEERVVKAAKIRDYSDFLPRLIKKHLTDFIDIINAYNDLNPTNVTLGKKCVESFLNKSKGIEALINNPGKFLQFLPLKIVTQKLNKEQFELMFRNLFPKNYENFWFDHMLDYLEHQPNEMKLPLILNTFQNLYGVDLLTLTDRVTITMMLMLPDEDRVKIAREKLITHPMEKYDWERAWICYLPADESIPKLKDEISKSKSADDRILLVGQLLYTCKVNQSHDHLLQILQYLSSKHRNEVSYFWSTFYSYLLSIFTLELLSKKHWSVISEMIQRSYVKNTLMERQNVSEQLLEKSILFNLMNDLPIDDRITMLAELKIKGWNSHFNILQDHPKYEKICLQKFLEIIPQKFPEGHSIWPDTKLSTMKCLIFSIYNYNKRMKLDAKKERKQLPVEGELSILNYPWLVENLKKDIDNKENKYKNIIQEIKRILFENERKFHDSLFPEEEKVKTVEDQNGLRVLKRNPDEIIENWEKYFKSCQKNISDFHARRFLKKCTWYSQIPIKFLEETLKKLQEGKFDSIMILALLLPGGEFTKIIEPLLPKSERMEIEGEDARNLYSQASSIPPAINQVNPPPPLNLVAKFCHGDYMQLGLKSLTNVARRVSVQQVIAFALTLVQKPITVKKHGIRLFVVVAPSANLCEFLLNMWTNDEHKSIREVVFEKSHKLFCDQPSDDSWNLIKEMIKTLTIDDRECFGHLQRLKNIPNEYLENYFQQSLKKVDDLQKEESSEKEMTRIIIHFLSSLNKKNFHFTEEYCEYLMQNFLFNLERDEEIIDRARIHVTEYFFNTNSLRLNYFRHLSTAIREKWGKSHPDKFRFYPMRKLFRKIVEQCYEDNVDIEVLQSMFNLFEKSVLRPRQDFKSYLILFFGIKLREVEFDGNVFGTWVGNQLPQIVEIFSSEMLVEIAKFLANFLNSGIIGQVTQLLVDFNSSHSSIVAAGILCEKYDRISDDLYKDIVEKLREVNNVTVETLLNTHVTSIS